MAVLASIAVYQCDSCGEIAVCRDEASWQRYETEWHETVIHQFCIKCRILPAIGKIIVADRNALISAMQRDWVEPTESAYAN